MAARPGTGYQRNLSCLVSIADQCLYGSKAAGRNRIEASDLRNRAGKVAG